MFSLFSCVFLFFLSPLNYCKNAYTHHYSCTWHSELFDISHLNLFVKDLVPRCSEADSAKGWKNGEEREERERARKKREECRVRGKRRACFPRRNPRVSDLDSRLTKLAKYSKLSHPLVFSPLSRSIPRLESTLHLRRLCLPVSLFFSSSLAPQLRVRVEGKRSLPRISRLSRLSTTSILLAWSSRDVHRDLYFCVSCEHNYILVSLFFFFVLNNFFALVERNNFSLSSSRVCQSRFSYISLFRSFMYGISILFVPCDLFRPTTVTILFMFFEALILSFLHFLPQLLGLPWKKKTLRQ